MEHGRDNIIRMVKVKYFNGHDKTPEFTLRTVRKLVKLWDIDDVSLADDLAEMQKKFGPIPNVVSDDQSEADDTDLTNTDQGGVHAEQTNEHILQDTAVDAEGACGGVHPPADEGLDEGAGADLHLADVRELPAGGRKQCKACCCQAHHKYSLHFKGKKYLDLPTSNVCQVSPVLVMQFDKDQDPMDNCGHLEGLEALLMSTNLDISAVL